MRQRQGSRLRLAVATAAAAAAIAACQPPDDRPLDAGSDAARHVTYTKDVQPILVAKCSPCHAGQDQGHHNLATTYADATKLVQSLDAQGCWNDADMTKPKTIGECALISVMRGWMPLAKGCGAPTPPEPEACLSAAEKDLLGAWIAAGLPQ